MLINVESNRSVEEVRKRIEEKAKERGFGVLAVHEVTNILESKGFPISYSSVIVEICQPKAASQVLSKNPYVATAMPCRIAIFEKDGRTILSTIAPTQLVEMFNDPGLKETAEELEEIIREMMEEASESTTPP